MEVLPSMPHTLSPSALLPPPDLGCFLILPPLPLWHPTAIFLPPFLPCVFLNNASIPTSDARKHVRSPARQSVFSRIRDYLHASPRVFS